MSENTINISEFALELENLSSSYDVVLDLLVAIENSFSERLSTLEKKVEDLEFKNEELKEIITENSQTITGLLARNRSEFKETLKNNNFTEVIKESKNKNNYCKEVNTDELTNSQLNKLKELVKSYKDSMHNQELFDISNRFNNKTNEQTISSRSKYIGTESLDDTSSSENTNEKTKYSLAEDSEKNENSENQKRKISHVVFLNGKRIL